MSAISPGQRRECAAFFERPPQSTILSMAAPLSLPPVLHESMSSVEVGKGKLLVRKPLTTPTADCDPFHTRSSRSDPVTPATTARAVCPPEASPLPRELNLTPPRWTARPTASPGSTSCRRQLGAAELLGRGL